MVSIWLHLQNNHNHAGASSAAQILEHILKEAWRLECNDKDMIVMYHEFKYRDNLNKQTTLEGYIKDPEIGVGVKKSGKVKLKK